VRPAESAEPAEPILLLAKNKGFLIEVETKGGSTPGRAKQSYILLQRNQDYILQPGYRHKILSVNICSYNSDVSRPVKFQEVELESESESESETDLETELAELDYT